MNTPGSAEYATRNPMLAARSTTYAEPGAIEGDFSEWVDRHRVDLTGIDRSSVVGIGNALSELDLLLAVLARPDLAREANAKLPRGVILHGAPGCGKSLLA